MTIKENKILDDPYAHERRDTPPPGYVMIKRKKRKEVQVDDILEELKDLGLENVHILKIEERR